MTKQQQQQIMNIYETLNQLTGSQAGITRLTVMIGANTFVQRAANSVSFKFKGNRKYNYCQITLNAADTYDVIIGKVTMSVINLDTTEGLYNDQLKSHFENTTGLYLSL